MKVQPQSSLKDLEAKRVAYANVAWLSNSGIETLVINMDDDYIVNVLRIVANKMQVAQQFPLVREFQSYNGIAYQNYAEVLYSEYLYRKAVEGLRIENMYQQHMNHIENVQGSNWNHFGMNSRIYR